jgi:hypothetical protein
MESRKEVKKKINVFEAMHYIMAASQWIAMWQQVALKVLKNYAKHMGLQGVWRKKMKTKINKRWCQASPRLTKL